MTTRRHRLVAGNADAIDIARPVDDDVVVQGGVVKVGVPLQTS